MCYDLCALTLCQKLPYRIGKVGNLPFLGNQHRIYFKATKISQVTVKSVLATLNDNVGALDLCARDKLFLSNADVPSLSDEL